MVKSYTKEFKEQICKLIESGKSISEISREYGIAKSSLSTWRKQYTNSGSFRESDNLSETEKALRIALKENKQLRMENDILKQAALILAQK